MHERACAPPSDLMPLETVIQVCEPSRTLFLTGRAGGRRRHTSGAMTTVIPTVDFVCSTAPNAAVACTGRGQIFHRAKGTQQRQRTCAVSR